MPNLPHTADSRPATTHHSSCDTTIPTEVFLSCPYQLTEGTERLTHRKSRNSQPSAANGMGNKVSPTENTNP
jgi:hypothetical protein